MRELKDKIYNRQCITNKMSKTKIKIDNIKVRVTTIYNLREISCRNTIILCFCEVKYEYAFVKIVTFFFFQLYKSTYFIRGE